ncbi:hypothetical protein C8J57DRAFT_1111207 [Mycena rebaudengoi]|nr:hypothetical protein C8J57DRAFT_1111207 [Mycena rebaudengoi]
MHRHALSPSSSPARKRQRLSAAFSPPFDDQLADISPEDLAACDEIETRLSQSNSCPASSAIHLPAAAELKLHDDPENPFAATTNAHLSSPPKLLGFASASALRPTVQHNDYDRSPSPEAPPEPDYDSWFAPAQDLPSVAFQTAKFAAASALPSDPPVGFMTASNKGWIAPSSAALAKAKEKMDAIWSEESSSSLPITTKSQGGTENAFSIASNLPRLSSPERPALRTLHNSFNSPVTPSPASALPTFTSPLVDQLKGKGKAKPFKTPFLVQGGAKSGFSSSPLNPSFRTGVGSFITAGTQHPLATSSIIAPPETPLRAGPSAFATPIQPIQNTPRVVRKKPAAFVTPFKPGMKPGEPGRSQLQEKVKAVVLPANSVVGSPLRFNADDSQPGRNVLFNLTKPSDRQTLASCGLAPQEYTSPELEGMGIAVSELSQITPTMAEYYSFRAPSSVPVADSPPTLLGPAAALEELLSRGCSLATKLWVVNHWCLILWKLAGMVCLDPDRENDPHAKRWCWAEVIRQLLYRYERELNGGIRPPLRCIATQDAPASCPMVLCVSNITWSEAGVTDDGMPIEPHPELEVTDGWYRLRAQVDAPLARAVRKGTIRVGRKIGVASARLSSERKDASDVLEAYNSTKLVLSGNSSHLVPWHEKLGFKISPWVATMNSLTGDGGIVTAMDVVVLKAYPIAFLEFFEDENGEKQREGPRNERDEADANEQWKRRRDVHENKLQEELEKKQSRYLGYAERLERRAGSQFTPAEDNDPPDEIEDLYDELEDSARATGVISRVGPNTAGWLARFIKEQTEKERERAGEDIEQELKTLCPPREVRNFRVLVVQDACTRRRGANRSAQLTVWDVLSLAGSEEKAREGFQLGQRYVVTNLMPTQQSAWMDFGEGSEIYISTRRDSKWRRML